ncbi:diacylglycerol kinase family protein [Streptomyces sp. 8L]|uniref:diacylglycerol kinase family protein n=1 Tax=Streptomyces sp. 8L TaxID=2877242 RepID=UPI001CD5F213|nr:diacylglycerol kinase family protein [Streptomyces sp. 8L]MCA1217197.1 sphingosine kinase [Streptomyces sp. 8L]
MTSEITSGAGAGVTLVVNPSSGRGRGARAAAPAAAALRDAGLAVRTVVTRDAPAALLRAAAAVEAGTGALVAVGGDGMVSLALQAVAGTATPLGIVAAGSGNDYARSLGLPLRAPAAAARLAADVLKGPGPRPVDLGRAGGKWFATVLASGFDSKVNDRGNRMRRTAGRFRYEIAMLAELAALAPVPYRLTLDDGAEREVEAVLVAVGNTSSYGGGLRICPGADCGDGLFDVTVVGACSRTTLLRVFPRVYRGSHTGHRVVTVHRAAAVRLAAPAATTAATAYADGEPLGALPLTARCVPGALRLLAPPV